MPARTERPNTQKPMLIGERAVVNIKICDVDTKALIDTGSQVTTISRIFVDRNLRNVQVKPVTELLTLRAAGVAI